MHKYQEILVVLVVAAHHHHLHGAEVIATLEKKNNTIKIIITIGKDKTIGETIIIMTIEIRLNILNIDFILRYNSSSFIHFFCCYYCY